MTAKWERETSKKATTVLLKWYKSKGRLRPLHGEGQQDFTEKLKFEQIVMGNYIGIQKVLIDGGLEGRL
jgi:hypothetical protein